MIGQEYTIYDLGFNKFLSKKSDTFGGGMEISTAMKSEFANPVNPLAISSGEITQNITMIAGHLQSSNFVSGSAGWKIDYNGNLEANSGTFRGALVGNSLQIGTNGIHIDTSGNMWWGSSSTYASATIKISSAGAVNFTSGTFSGVIQTSSSGQRITINDTANTMIFYDSGGQVIGIGTEAGKAIKLTLTSGTNGGMSIVSAQGGVGIYYENTSNNNNVAFDVVTSDGSSTNTGNLPLFRVVHGGTNIIFDATLVGSGGGLKISRVVGSGAGYDIHLYNTISTGNTFIYIQKNGNGNTCGISIEQTITADSGSIHNRGIKINLATGGSSSKCYALSLQGSEVVSSAVGGTQDKKIRVEIGSTEYFIPCHTA